MRLRDLLPFALLGGIAAFIIAQRRALPSRPGQPAAVARATPAPAGEASDAPAVAVDPGPSREPPPERDDAAIRMKLTDGSPGTYMRDILEQQGQLLMRWPDRRLDALRVWIEPSSTVANWDPNFPLVAEKVFDEWREAGFPLRFDFQPVAAGADIQIRWSSQFVQSGQQIGVTSKTRDGNGWIVRAEIVIATHDGRGQPLPHAIIAGTARHEVGHALGLGHSPNPTDVMYPESRTPIISAADRATLHLLYVLPPGLVK